MSTSMKLLGLRAQPFYSVIICLEENHQAKNWWMLKMKKNIEEREERNDAQMGKVHTAAWPSSRGKQKITLCKKPDINLLCQMCLCSRNQRNSSPSSFFLLMHKASLPSCPLFIRGTPKVNPLFQWSSTDLRILLLLNYFINPAHTASLSPCTLVLLKTFILKKEKDKEQQINQTSVIIFQLLSS